MSVSDCGIIRDEPSLKTTRDRDYGAREHFQAFSQYSCLGQSSDDALEPIKTMRRKASRSCALFGEGNLKLTADCSPNLPGMTSLQEVP